MKKEVIAPEQHTVKVWDIEYIVQNIGAFQAFKLREQHSKADGTVDFAGLGEELIKHMVLKPQKLNLNQDFRSPEEIQELIVSLYNIAFPGKNDFLK